MVLKSSYQGALEMKQYARVQILNANISPKYARAIGIKIKGKTIKEAIKYLQNVAAQKKPLPLTKVRKVAHKKGAGVASGRYPKKTSDAIIKYLKQLRANADAKMLDTDAFRIIHFVANPGNRTKWSGYFKAQHGKRNGNPKIRTRQQYIEIIAGSIEAKDNVKKARLINKKQIPKLKTKGSNIKQKTKPRDVIDFKDDNSPKVSTSANITDFKDDNSPKVSTSANITDFKDDNSPKVSTSANITDFKDDNSPKVSTSATSAKGSKK